MRGTRGLLRHALSVLMFVGAGSVGAAPPSVTQTFPVANGLQASVETAIRVTFDTPVNPATLTRDSFRVFGRWSGDVQGTLRFSDDLHSVILEPSQPFSAGELVSVSLSRDVRAANNEPLREAGFAFQFWTASQAVDQMAFQEIAVMTTNTDTKSRPYGGVATDLNNDGWLDITVVNEDTADVRVFLNGADGTGAFKPFLQPPSPVGRRVSPSEPYDFNHDGNADLAAANINDNTVSVLLGNGDGTFKPQQLITVGTAPRGIAVLDVDGDGDGDLVNTNFTSNNLTLMLNNGSGIFGAATTLSSDVEGEFSLMAGDMNRDGISDLVVGGQNNQQIQVLLGRGDGTFERKPMQNSGGRSWQLMLGDVNADGNIDVATVNGRSDNGAILLGNGDGTLQSPTIYDLANMGPTGGNSWLLASDLGDMDGDGDLDWVTSSYAGGGGTGDWLVLLNDGNGEFNYYAELDAPLAASCGLLHDFDNDGDLDLGLIDEVADVLVLSKNIGKLHPKPLAGDFNQDQQLSVSDVDSLTQAVAATQDDLIYDVNHDGEVDRLDLDRWVHQLAQTSLGDANLNGQFDSADLVAVFQAGQYEDSLDGNSVWSSGDWNGDAEFNSNDLIVAFQDGGYSEDIEPAIAIVPEPVGAGGFPLLLGLLIRRVTAGKKN